MDLEQKILDAYRDGSPIGYIQECFGVSEEYIKKVLIDYKERNRYKRTFTDEFKQLIAERDMNGISRVQIASELNININTVKKACEQFGQAVKGRAFSENTYTVVEGVHSLEYCPKCGSKRVNEVDPVVGTKGIYCLNCGNEYFILGGQVYKVNWEYID